MDREGGTPGARARPPVLCTSLRVRAAVKTALESEQTETRELQAFPRLEQRRQRLPIGAPGESTSDQDLGQALPTRIAVGRAMFRGRYRPESDSYTAPRAARAPARALKSHLFHRCRLEETASGASLLTERS